MAKKSDYSLIFRPSLFTIHYFLAHYSPFIIKKGHYSLIIMPHPDSHALPVTIGFVYSFVEHDFNISHCNAYYLIILYSKFERNYFDFYYVSLRYSYFSHTHRLKKIVRGNINNYSINIFHGNINCKVFVC